MVDVISEITNGFKLWQSSQAICHLENMVSEALRLKEKFAVSYNMLPFSLFCILYQP